MSKKKTMICDICGDEIRGSHYFFPKSIRFFNIDYDGETIPCDICRLCFAKFKKFVKEERKTED